MNKYVCCGKVSHRIVNIFFVPYSQHVFFNILFSCWFRHVPNVTYLFVYLRFYLLAKVTFFGKLPLFTTSFFNTMYKWRLPTCAICREVGECSLILGNQFYNIMNKWSRTSYTTLVVTLSESRSAKLLVTWSEGAVLQLTLSMPTTVQESWEKYSLNAIGSYFMYTYIICPCINYKWWSRVISTPLTENFVSNHRGALIKYQIRYTAISSKTPKEWLLQ